MLLFLALACDGGKVSFGSGNLALSFEGAGCVEVPIDERANGPNLTIEYWMRGSPGHSLGVMPFIYWPEVMLAAELEDGTTWFGATDLVYGTTYTGALFDETPHHIAGTWDETGRLTFYVDGRSRGFAQSTRAATGSPLYLGCWNERSAFLEGALDEVRISTVLRYNDDFTPSETPFEPDEYTAALWHMDEGNGDVLLDASRHFDGTVEGVSWIETTDWYTAEDSAP